MFVTSIEFPAFSGIRCLMMPFVQGEPASVPDEYSPYRQIIEGIFLRKGEIGFLTIDESPVSAGIPHRGCRAKFGRALHTEAGRHADQEYAWGGGGWGKENPHRVTLDADVEVLLANSLNGTCAIWPDCVHADTTEDGDIGHCAEMYPYRDAVMMRAGDVHKIGILTPHESLPVSESGNRQFLRIIGSGVHGREPYFTINPILGEVSG